MAPRNSVPKQARPSNVAPATMVPSTPPVLIGEVVFGGSERLPRAEAVEREKGDVSSPTTVKTAAAATRAG
jgi:hypothetical protein